MRMGELEISPAAIIAAAALLQLLVVAAISALSKKKAPKLRLRGTELALLGSACAFIVAITITHMSTAPHQQAATPVQASVTGVARHHHGSCNSIHREMASREVEGNLGKADEVRSDEETRGPGAAVWIYRDSRCAVHIFGDKVEFVE